MDDPLDFRKEHEKKRHEELLTLRDMIGAAGDKIPLIQRNLLPHLAQLRKDGDYAGYISFGTQIIEFYLGKLLIVYTHSINLNLRQIEASVPIAYLHDLDIHASKNDTSGKILEKLNTIFRMDKKHPGAAKLFKSLIEKRNVAAHDLIENFDGDLKKLNDELKPFSETEPVEEALAHILDIQSRIVDSNNAVVSGLKLTKRS